MTVIPQDATLFTGTLRFNIDPYDEVSDERIISVLKEASLDDLLLRENGKGLKFLI